MSLQERYAAMDTKELVNIITIYKEQYTSEAIRAAEDELRNRGETNETLAPIMKETQEEKLILDKHQKAIEEQPLSDTQKALFTMLPGIAFYYSIFTPGDWKKLKLEANLCQFLGLSWYIGIGTLFFAVIEIHKPGKDSPDIYFFFLLEIVCFLISFFSYRRAKRKLSAMA